MRFLTQTGLVLGLLLFITLLVWQGFMDVLRLLLASGWWLLLLPLVWLPSLFIATQGWRKLFPASQVPEYSHTLAAMWLGRAVNNLLPVATIGGEIVKARVVALWGSSGLNSAASVMVDKAVQALAVAVWGIIGVISLLAIKSDADIAGLAITGFVILTVCAVGFMRIQHLGMLGIMAKLGGKLIKTESWGDLTLNAYEVDGRIREIYRDRHRVVVCLLYRTGALCIQTLEVWLACYLLGHPLGFLEAVMLKSLTSTLSDVAFIIPNAYGVQEGAFIILGALIGIGPETALAVSLAIRIRDLLLDPAGLFYLHHVESRQYFSRYKADT